MIASWSGVFSGWSLHVFLAPVWILSRCFDFLLHFDSEGADGFMQQLLFFLQETGTAPAMKLVSQRISELLVYVHCLKQQPLELTERISISKPLT